MGGCGLRRQVTIAEFAHECVGHKNLQRSKTEEADRDLSNALFATVYGAERQVLTANAAAGAGRALTDPQVCTDDAGILHLRAGAVAGARAARRPKVRLRRGRLQLARAHVHQAARQAAPAAPRRGEQQACAGAALVRLRLHDGAAPQRGEQAAARPAHHGPRHTGRHRRDGHAPGGAPARRQAQRQPQRHHDVRGGAGSVQPRPQRQGALSGEVPQVRALGVAERPQLCALCAADERRRVRAEPHLAAQGDREPRPPAHGHDGVRLCHRRRGGRGAARNVHVFAVAGSGSGCEARAG
ncbi:hypothetical protein ERJ75_000916900 [Trypanosoma vivax]|nr:hypothetical protein ERJ75_000916900 [Trypanosoma vivax]